MMDTPMNAEFSTWLKEVQETGAPEEKVKANRHNKRWEDMGSDNAEPPSMPSSEDPPTDDRAATG